MNESLLDIDERIEWLLKTEEPRERPAALVPRTIVGDMVPDNIADLIAEDETRALWGLGRALRREQKMHELLVRESSAIHDEYARRLTASRDRVGLLTTYIEDIVLARRERGEGNSVDLPGIGQWSSRAVRAGWTVASGAEVDRALVAFLRANYEAEATVIIEERPTVKREQLRVWLDSLDDEAIVPVIDRLGQYIERRPERISVSFKSA